MKTEGSAIGAANVHPRGTKSTVHPYLRLQYKKIPFPPTCARMSGKALSPSTHHPHFLHPPLSFPTCALMSGKALLAASTLASASSGSSEAKNGCMRVSK